MASLLDPAHIAQALVLLALVLSEILPFLPSKANGIVQALISIARAVGGALKSKPPADGGAK